MIRNPTNLFGLQRWWSEAWWNHKILKIETSSKKAPYGPIKSNIIKICFTRSPYPFLNLNEIQTTPGPKKTNPGRKRGSRIEPTYVHVLWRKLLISLQKQAPTRVDTFSRARQKNENVVRPKMETRCIRYVLILSNSLERRPHSEHACKQQSRASNKSNCFHRRQQRQEHLRTWYGRAASTDDLVKQHMAT